MKALVFVAALSTPAICQPTVQDYAKFCYAELGITGKVPESFACSDGKKLARVSTADPYKQPAWLGSGFEDPADASKTHQCYGNTYIQSINIAGAFTGALFCRHKITDNAALTDFDDIAMIFHDSDTGKTCWFQTADGYVRNAAGAITGVTKLDGTKIPAPHTKDADKFWLPPKTTASIRCGMCHDNGPWMNSPWLYGQYSAFENGARTPYTSIDDGAKFGFSDWPTPAFVSVGSSGIKDAKFKECTHCHKITAKTTWKVRRKNAAGVPIVVDVATGTYTRWLAWVNGSATPTGSSAKAPADYDITHWMPVDTRRPDFMKYDDIYKNHYIALKTCMEALGTGAAGAPPADCKPGKIKKPAAAPAVAAPASADGIQLRVNVLSGPGGARLPVLDSSGNPVSNPVSNMQSEDDPVIVPQGSYLTMEWVGNSACGVVTTFPSGVVTKPLSGSSADPVGTGSNWTMDETPQDVGFLDEPGEYWFHLDCGLLDGTHKETSTEVRVKVAGLPPTMLRLDTSVNSNLQAEAVDFMSYANPGNSYTSPQIIPPATPQTDVGVAASDPVRIAWLTDNVMPGSCQVTEVGPNPVTTTPTPGDSGELFVSLDSAPTRVFRLRCSDMNGQPHTLAGC